LLPSAICLEVKENQTLLTGPEGHSKGQDETVTDDITGNFNFKQVKKIISVIAIKHSNGLSKEAAEFPFVKIFRPQWSNPEHHGLALALSLL